MLNSIKYWKFNIMLIDSCLPKGSNCRAHCGKFLFIGCVVCDVTANRHRNFDVEEMLMVKLN